jgi:hypothetical protein
VLSGFIVRGEAHPEEDLLERACPMRGHQVGRAVLDKKSPLAHEPNLRRWRAQHIFQKFFQLNYLDLKKKIIDRMEMRGIGEYWET